ncbi:MAG: VacB/RNase II family 3'-5' exoribonuclease, partial [Planctomycetes bacterium]|nr:VacB/RNase II family 3'-5' exoribonuclease [Planctomycetota bacterium]
LHVPIFIGDVGAKSARAGDQVVVEIIRYPSHEVDARGVIVKVLGRSGDPETDTLSIIHQYQLPHEFDEAVLESARRAIAEHDVEQAVVGREDLREQTVVTIDPDDARDFDDAISITSKGEGRLELGVHIADVSLFVQPGTALDDEARQRGNSVYFPQRVIPMLPEVLSNGLCSLQQGQPRLTKSAFITYDKNGKVVATRFANSVIHSTRRLTYREASGVMEGKTGGLSRPVVELLRDMESLARAIEKRRRADGMIELNLPEVELVFDKGGKVTGLQPVDVSYSHKIIEMFMIEANEAVARLFVSKNVPHLRRVHPAPEATADANLTKFLRAIGLSAPRLDDRQGVQGLLDSVRNKPQAFAVNLAVLRSMQRAEYAPKLIGHFALASNDYSHFTSPIRRYPDLTVHRLLDVFLAGGLESPACSDDVPTTEELEVLGAHCSHQERRAEAAERELHLIKVLRLLEDRVGDVLTGIVTGVTNFGIFVQLNEYLIEGLIRFEALGDDWWEVDTIRGCVIGQRSGKRYVIGQMIDAVIVGVDVGARQLDLADAQSVAGGDLRPAAKGADPHRRPTPETNRVRRTKKSKPGKSRHKSSTKRIVRRRRKR